MNTQTTLKAALLLTILAMLTACGSFKQNDLTEFSSRAPVDTPTAKTELIYCNEKTQSGITAKVVAYTDAANQIRYDYMKVKFTKMPSSFGSGDYIHFYRWQANAAGQTYIDRNPVQARFETLDGQILTNFDSVMHWGQVSAIAAKWGITDVNKFFQYVRLVIDIRDPQAEFDALKIAMYNTNNVNTINMDMLMPAFAARPADYANDRGATRAMSLQALHPFASMINENWTAAQFKSMTTNFCF
ncbi:hypothetical protein [Bdellovibrio sp. HCB337]|uniref:hypothetical protein n=1 Tax=Bdellovibrio sp. HCB337 TaxID=3394358 RepID=UPI0039A47726